MARFKLVIYLSESAEIFNYSRLLVDEEVQYHTPMSRIQLPISHFRTHMNVVSSLLNTMGNIQTIHFTLIVFSESLGNHNISKEMSLNTAKTLLKENIDLIEKRLLSYPEDFPNSQEESYRCPSCSPGQDRLNHG